MAGLFSSSEQDLVGNIMTQRQQANQALGSGYGKYGGIVQAAGGLIDTGTDAMFGGKVGAADPRMQQMSKVKDIFAKVTKELGDVKSPAFYERLSQELQAAGFPEQAQKAADEAMKQKKQGYEMGAMERDENYRKELAALGANPTTAQLAALDQKYGNVEGVRAAATAAEAEAKKKAVTEKEAKRIKTIAEALVKRDPKLPLAFAEVIAGDAKALMDFVNPKVKTQVVSVNKRELLINSDTGVTIKDLGNSTSKAPIINIAGNQENEFAKGRGKNQADELRDAKKAAGSSKVALLSLEQMERVNIDGIYSGPQADVLLATNGFLESVGLLSSDQVGKLTNSATYDKNAKDLVMLDLDGKLGAQVSDADRKYVEARIPQLRTNPQARTELIVKLREIHNNKIDKARKMVAHANEFDNLNDFNWDPPKPKTADQGWGIKKKGDS
jgi:hypothetical protein